MSIQENSGSSDSDEQFAKDALPPGITRLNQWVTWGNMDTEKRPTQPLPRDIPASSTDPETWRSVDTALNYVTPGRDGRGLGFALTEDDPYLAFDIDCPNHAENSLPTWLPPLDNLGCSAWVYRTPSRRGWRIVVKADDGCVIPDWWTDISDESNGETREIALTYAGKYMTVTDDVLSTHRVPGNITTDDLNTWLQAAYTLFTGEPAPTNRTATTTADTQGREKTTTRPDTDPELSIYDIISQVKYPEGKRVTHPYHSSDTGGNFMVDDDNDADSWRCWRHDVTGHAGHLLGMEMDVISCNDVHGTLSKREWAEIYEAARQRGYEIPDPRNGGNEVSPSPGDCGGGSSSGSGGNKPDVASRWQRYDETITDQSVTASHAVAANLLLDEFDIRTERDSETIYLYNEETGIYSPHGEDALKGALMDPKRAGDRYNRSRGSEILHQVKTHTKVPTEALGGAPTTLVVANGTLDWGTTAKGTPQLRAHSPDDTALTALPVAYDPDAECPRWKQFVGDVVESGMEETVQEYVGYCLATNDMPFHKALMLVGDGANGKSQFLDVVKRLLGEDNHTSHSLQDVSENAFARAQLFRSLVNIHGDLSPVALGADSMFKTLVGGDTLTAEQKYKPPFQFRPTAKHIYAANQVPEVQTDDDAFFRRWLLVEFPNTFTGDDRVNNLGRKIFEEEASGILNWALEGRRRLFAQDGFTNDDSPAATRERWTSWGDTIARFTNECLQATGDNDDRMPVRKVYEHYQQYVMTLQDESEDTMSQQKVTQEVQNALPSVQYGSYRFDGSKARGFIGIALTDEWLAARSEQ